MRFTCIMYLAGNQVIKTPLTVAHGILLCIIALGIKVEFVHLSCTRENEVGAIECSRVDPAPFCFTIVAIADFDFSFKKVH